MILMILAILTRHVTYKDFKDTKKVTIFSFAVSFVYCICIPLKCIMDDGLASFVVNLLPTLATIVLSLLFIVSPKILPVIRRKLLRIFGKTHITGKVSTDHAFLMYLMYMVRITYLIHLYTCIIAIISSANSYLI